MPATNLPSTFASAAAGQAPGRDSRAGQGRADARGGAGTDWSRRDGRSSNGTLTFRRPSATPFSQASQASAGTDSQTSTTGVDSASVPTTSTASSSLADTSSPARYTRDELMEVYKSTRDHASAQPSVSSLFANGWTPGQTNGSSTRGWGKSSDTPLPQDPDVCWDQAGTIKPMWTQEMSQEEKELFSDINSPLKPPLQNKDGGHQGAGINGRKASMSHGSGHGYGVSSPPSSSRPGPRRRETTDTNPFPSSSSLVSPTANRYSREDQGFWLGRKSTDTKESLEDADEDATTSRDPKAPPFGGLARSNTAGSAGFAASSALWGGSAGGGMSGGFGNFALPSAVGDKKAPAGRGESRLAHLLPKDSAETVGSKAGESSNAESSRSWRTRPRTDTDPFGGDDLPGSRSQGFEATGNAAIDMTMSGLSLSGDMAGSGHGRMSPAGTNPYRSPPVERGELDEQGEHGPDKPHGAGGLSEQSSAFGGGAARTFGSNVGVEGSDRSQTSSVGPKVYPPLGSLGGWPAGASGAGSGQDPRSAFGGAIGGSLFNPVSEVHSPGLSSFGGGVFGPASAGLPGASAIGSRSKLGSLFPPSMQAQMQEQESLDASSDLRHGNPLGAIGRSTSIGPHLRETDSPMRAGRGAFDELFPVTSEPGRAPALGLSSDAMPLNASMAQTPFSSAPTTGPGFGTLPATASDLPHLGSRLEMVMPDRMRWVYLDPQGQQQGPFSGLEMHDWFKANFFTADLRVRRVEDPDFEPLAQLIRRIGNSREPFLVPQVGIPHGPPSQTGPFSPTAAGGIIQPPLPGALPAFGRTLTAEEQNNLERRKQEEQMMLARQRELIQQQQMARFAGPGLQHQSSQHSLHSQQSYGSMTNAMPPLAPPTQLGMGPAFFDPSTGLTPQAPVPKAIGSGAELFRDVEIGQLSRPDRDAFAPVAGEASMTNVFQQGAAPAPSAPIAPIAPSAATSDLRAHLPSVDSLQDDKEGFKARLQEFNRLREDLDRETEERFSVPSETRDSSRQVSGQAPSSEARVETATAKTSKAEVDVKKAAEPQPSQAAAQQPQKPAVTTTAKQASPAATAGLPMPFPAPASHSQPQTPELAAAPPAVSAQPPPLAPWASTESHKGPSLKEIQAAEARKAAKAEEAAAAARRAALEQEVMAARERERAAAQAAANSGLPTTSTWGSGGSPVTAGPQPSAWGAKPPAVKGSAAGATGAGVGAPGAAAGPKKTKTLAEIQREEEARKQRARELMMQSGANAASQGGPQGKRYADLAGRQTTPTPAQQQQMAAAAAASGGGWATVGAGGKVKPAPSSTPARTASAGAVRQPTGPTVVKAAQKAAPAPSGAAGAAKPENAAMDEFNKWMRRELSRGVSAGVNVDTLCATLLVLPLDNSLIADAVYASTTTMDARHFAEEFIRRKKLADKGVVEKSTPSAGGASSGSGADGPKGAGWSEVAKKGSKDNDAASAPAGFKVVPSRKKGKK